MGNTHDDSATERMQHMKVIIEKAPEEYGGGFLARSIESKDKKVYTRWSTDSTRSFLWRAPSFRRTFTWFLVRHYAA